MGIETTLDGRQDKEYCELPKETNHSRSKKSRRRQKKSATVQNLFQTCKEVFASGATGFIPPPADVERLRLVLDRMKPEDVGLNPEMPYFRPKVNKGLPKITYLHLHECEKFSIGIFCLPPSGVIPLHNHPGMTVFIEPSRVKLAKVKVDSDFTAPCNTSILYPAAGGNMHCFTAITACAVLDVLGPPYSDPDGRHCTYYLDFPCPSLSGNGQSDAEEKKEVYAWLQEREKPDELDVVGALYRGPKLVEN